MGNVTSRDPVTGVAMMKPLAERKKMYKQAEKAMPAKSKKALKTVSDLIENVIKDVKDKQKKFSGNGMCNCGMCDVCYGGTLGTPDNMMSQTFRDGLNLSERLPFSERPRTPYTGNRPIISNPIRGVPAIPIGSRQDPRRSGLTLRPISTIPGSRSIGDGLKKSRKGNSKAKARGQMVSELMKKEGLTLGQASKKLASMNK